MKYNPIKIYKEASPAVRTSLWFTICNFLQRGTAFLTVPIFTRLLTTKQYGVYSVYLSWFDIFVLFSSLKIPYEGLINGLIRHERDKDGYVSSMVGLITTLTFGCAAVYLIFRKWIDAVTGFSSFIMVLMFLEILFNPPLYLWTNRERFDFRYRWPVVVTILSTILNPLIAVIAVLCTPYKAEARIIATVAVQAGFGFVLFLLLLKRGKKWYDREYWKFALKFNLSLLFYYISQSLLNQSDRIMINYFEGSDKAGIYSVAYSAATLMLLLVSAVNASFNPWMYKKLKDYRYEEVRKAVTMVCALIGAATVAMIAFAPDLIALLATREYSEAIWIIPPVAGSVFFIFVYMVFANAEMYYGETRFISLISIAASAANLVLNCIFIPIYGYMAAGWTTLVCYVLLAVLHFILMERTRRLHHIRDEIFPVRQIFLFSVGIIAASGLMLGTYLLGYVRYVILALILFMTWLFRRRILALVRMLKKC